MIREAEFLEVIDRKDVCFLFEVHTTERRNSIVRGFTNEREMEPCELEFYISLFGEERIMDRAGVYYNEPCRDGLREAKKLREQELLNGLEKGEVA